MDIGHSLIAVGEVTGTLLKVRALSKPHLGSRDLDND